MVRSMEGRHPLYYEAVLQLRDVADEVVRFVKDEVVRTGLNITKSAKVRNGYDFFCSDKDLTKALGKRLQETFGGMFLTTASLYTQKDGKDVYRITILFRGLPFTKGSSVMYKGDAWKIAILGKEIYLQGQGGKKMRVKYKDMLQ